MIANINIPPAADFATSGTDCLAVYLIPEGESDDDGPRIAVHHHHDSRPPWPMVAWHGRWRRVYVSGRGVVGESLRRAIVDASSTLLAAAAEYQGREWDGSNYVGKWTELGDELISDAAVEIDSCELDYHWDARDWLDGLDWATAAHEACVDLDEGRDHAIETVARYLETIAVGEGAHLTGLDEAVARLADEHSAEHAAGATDAV